MTSLGFSCHPSPFQGFLALFGQKAPKRIGITSLGFLGLSFQSISGFCGLFRPENFKTDWDDSPCRGFLAKIPPSNACHGCPVAGLISMYIDCCFRSDSFKLGGAAQKLAKPPRRQQMLLQGPSLHNCFQLENLRTSSSKLTFSLSICSR